MVDDDTAIWLGGFVVLELDLDHWHLFSFEKGDKAYMGYVFPVAFRG